MKIIDQEEGETFVDHLLRNCDAYGLTVMHKARLRQAQRLQGGNRADQRRARDYGARVQAEILAAARRDLAAAEHRAIIAGLFETEATEVRQGGAVEAFNDSGARRMISRDGFATLRESGRLTASECASGLAFRALYEATSCDLRSQLEDRPGGGSGSNDGLIGARLLLAQSTVMRAKIERRVIAASRGDPKRRGARELKALRLIAGEGRALSSLNRGGAMQAIYLAALIRALDVVAVVLREPLDEALTG